MILLYLAVAAAYLAAAWLEWTLLAKPANAAPQRWTAATSWLPAIAVTGHLLIVARALLLVDEPDLSLVNALSMVGGLAALFAWVGSLSHALPGATVVTFPVAAIALVLSATFSNPHPFPLGEAPLARAHVAIALVAYALLIVAALQASVLLGLEKRLHRGLPEPRAASMPPLLMLERFLFRIVSAGFVLLTFTLASGILFSEELFGKPLTFTHKTVFSVLSWLAYAALLLGRYRFGWRGRTALNWILISSVLLVLAYIGSKFVLEVILHR
jgi:ABC-type uncharacterized transport system permease subunit